MKKAKIKILYVKITDGNVLIRFEKQTEDGIETGEFNSPDKPRKSFQDAYNDLVPHLVEICELPKEWAPDIVMSSLSISYKGERNTMGAVISATRTLRHSRTPMNISSPFKQINDSGADLQGDSQIFLSPAFLKVAGAVAGEAKLFMEGARVGDNQLKIFNEFENAGQKNSPQKELEEEIKEVESGTTDAIADDAPPKRIKTSDRIPASKTNIVEFEVTEKREKEFQAQTVKDLDVQKVPKKDKSKR